MYVCTYVCMYVRMYVCTYVRTYVCMYVCNVLYCIVLHCIVLYCTFYCIVLHWIVLYLYVYIYHIYICISTCMYASIHVYSKPEREKKLKSNPENSWKLTLFWTFPWLRCAKTPPCGLGAGPEARPRKGERYQLLFYIIMVPIKLYYTSYYY